MKVKNDHRSKCWTWAGCLKLISTWQAKSFFDGMDQRALEISKQCLFLFSAFRPVMFSCGFFVVSVLFWSFFSFVSLFCFSFPFVYFSIFSNPGWHASLFESSNLAKCFQICRVSHTYDLLHVALAKNNDAIDRKWNCTSLATREIMRKIGHWALNLLTLILKCKCGYFFVILKLMSDVRKCFYKCVINVIIIIIQSKYFSVSYWLKSHA